MKPQIPLQKHPDTIDSIITQMLEAFRQAIREARCTATRHIAVEGKQHFAEGEGNYYTFTLQDDDWEPGPNTNIRVEIDSKTPEYGIPGTILSSSDMTITLVTETPLPEIILPRIVLFEEDVWLLEKHRDALLALQQREEISMQMAAKIFGLFPSSEGFGQLQVHLPNFSPDEDQVRAITMGMQRECTYLVGPGGTGKTAVIGQLSLEWLHRKKTVLIVAQTNNALDTLVKRIKPYCEESGMADLLREHRVVRLGKTNQLAGKEYSDITLQGIVDQQLGLLAQERDQLQQQRSDLEEMIARLSRDLPLRQMQWQQTQQTVQMRQDEARTALQPLLKIQAQRLEPLYARLEAIAQEKERQLKRRDAAAPAVQYYVALLQGSPLQKTVGKLVEREAWEQIVADKREELRLFKERSFGDRLLAHLSGISEKSLQTAVEESEQALREAKRLVTGYEAKRNIESQNMMQANVEFNKLYKEEQEVLIRCQWVSPEDEKIQYLQKQIAQNEQAIQRGEVTLEGMKQELKEARSIYAKAVEKLKDIEDKQRTIISHVVENAQLIVTTLTGLTTNSSLKARMFDAVVVDEASMASLASVLIAAPFARQHVVIVGDPYQLAPIVKVKKQKAPHAAYWLGTDVFSHLGLTLRDADAGRRHVVFLSRQARMHPAIAAPDSEFIYGGRLKTREDLMRTPLHLAPQPECPLLVINTSDVDQEEAQLNRKLCVTKRPQGGGTSKYNLYHIQCVVRLVELLIPQLYPNPSNVVPIRIGVVTPYKPQKYRIRNALRVRGLDHLVHVGTAHSFQSAEYDCMIFDTVEAPGVPISQFTSDMWGVNGIAHDATRLINVAHSRARDKLIYIAHVEYINGSSYRKHHILTQFVNYGYAQRYINSCELIKQTNPALKAKAERGKCESHSSSEDF